MGLFIMFKKGMILMVEEWKDIVIEKNGILYNFTGKYQVSNMGRVRNVKTGRVLKFGKIKNGYLIVGLRKDGKTRMFYVHRLVATAFIENDDPINKTEVNHISEVKTENFVWNLEWVTHKQNANHGTRTERAIAKSRVGSSKPIYYIDEESGVAVVYFNTMCAELDGYTHSGIINCLKGRLKTHRGKKWRYVGGK